MLVGEADDSTHAPQDYQSSRISESSLKQQSDGFMKNFDNEERLKKEEEEASIGMPDEDGFIKGW